MKERRLLPDEIALLPEATMEVFSLFKNKGYQIYLVGAGVRNILAGKRPVDCDFTTDASPEEILQMTEEWEPFYDNPYGTVGIPVEIEGEEEVYEITPFRSEKSYSDNRRPDEVEWGVSLKEDVKRRDFTMNSVVLGPKEVGEKTKMELVLIDHLKGLEDFENGLIRAVGNAEERFGEDALRMMRAIRFAAQLSFKIEEKTLQAVKAKAELLSEISKERVRDELFKIVKSDYPADGVHLLTTTGLMEQIMPEVLEARGIPQTGHHTLDVYSHMLESLRHCPSSDVVVRLASFLHDVGKPRARKLRCIECGWVMKKKDLLVKGETAKMTQYQCPRCKTKQSEHQAGSFWSHEVVGTEITEEIVERLRLSNRQKEKLLILVRWHMFAYDPKMTDAAIRRFIRRVGKENINDMMLLRVGDRKGGGSKATSWRLRELQERIGEQLYEPMEVRDMVVDGKDVMEILGLEPGPRVGAVLKELFEEVIEDTDKNKREYLLERIKEMGKER